MARVRPNLHRNRPNMAGGPDRLSFRHPRVSRRSRCILRRCGGRPREAMCDGGSTRSGPRRIRFRANSGRRWRNSGTSQLRLPANLAEIGGQMWPIPGERLGPVRRTPSEIGPTFADAGAEVGQLRPYNGHLGPNSAKFGQAWAMSMGVSLVCVDKIGQRSGSCSPRRAGPGGLPYACTVANIQLAHSNTVVRCLVSVVAQSEIVCVLRRSVPITAWMGFARRVHTCAQRSFRTLFEQGDLHRAGAQKVHTRSATHGQAGSLRPAPPFPRARGDARRAVVQVKRPRRRKRSCSKQQARLTTRAAN